MGRGQVSPAPFAAVGSTWTAVGFVVASLNLAIAIAVSKARSRRRSFGPMVFAPAMRLPKAVTASPKARTSSKAPQRRMRGLNARPRRLPDPHPTPDSAVGDLVAGVQRPLRSRRPPDREEEEAGCTDWSRSWTAPGARGPEAVGARAPRGFVPVNERQRNHRGGSARRAPSGRRNGGGGLRVTSPRSSEYADVGRRILPDAAPSMFDATTSRLVVVSAWPRVQDHG
jgi:hypothetical protein